MSRDLDRTKKQKHPWARDFVIMPKEKLDDLAISQREAREQLTKKVTYSNTRVINKVY